MIPEIESMDLICIPEDPVDCKIFLAELISKLEKEQPLLYSYATFLKKLHGEHACLACLIVFKAIENAIERNENGFF
jgi:hypothetical protein